MFTRITMITVACIVAATLAAAQSPHLDSITPVGPNPTDQTSIQFDAVFSEPVSGAISAWSSTGTLVATVSASARSEFDESIDLTTTTHVAEAPSGITLPNSFTVEFWCHPNVAGADAVFSYADPGSGPNMNSITYLTDGDVYLDEILVGNTGALAAARWSHVAIRYDFPTSTVDVFVNGTVAMSNTLATVITGGGFLALGQDQDGSPGAGYSAGQAFPGRIDEVRIWGVARTAGQITSNMFSPVSPGSANLLHYWSFDYVADLGVGSPGANDVADLAGAAHLSLEAGLGQANSDVPSTDYTLDVSISGVTSPGSLSFTADLGVAEDVDGNTLVQNPAGGAASIGIVHRPCTAPQAIAQAAPNPTADTNPRRTLVFDQVVSGVTDSDLTVGGVAPSGATVSTSVGFDNAIELPNDPTFPRLRSFNAPNVFPNTGAMTVELWFLTNNPTGEATLVSFATPLSTNTFVLFAKGAIVITGVGTLPNVDLGQLDGGWHHMAVTRSAAGVLKRYVDGIPAGTFEGTSSTLGDDGDLIFGQEQDLPDGGYQQSQALEGAFDEIRLWSVERSEADIVADMGREIDPMTPGLYAYYRCEVAESLQVGSSTAVDDLRDHSPGGRHLDIQPAATFNDAVDRANDWNVDFTFPGVTSFLELDVAGGNGIVGACGLNAVGDPSGEPAIEHVYVEDMSAEVSVNGAPAEYYLAGATPGDQLLFNWRSPGGTHDWASTLSVFGQLIATGTEPGDVGTFGFPELRIDLFSPQAPFIIYDGATQGPFAPTVLAPGGLTIAAVAPIGLGGFSLSCQPLANGNTTTTNGFFAAGNVLIVDL